ncbi:MAG: hypothetical protein QM638_01095 [Nocardioides sp.]|uniref:hypothetical protein n=1 Tax=Nocardioides sp. TaxID=35761 RepID=UPI0039E549F6
MSSGPEHYSTAEAQLAKAERGGEFHQVMANIGLAQAHATLAFVAALHDRETGTLAQLRADEWREATR